jgi:hypothetical protein
MASSAGRWFALLFLALTIWGGSVSLAQPNPDERLDPPGTAGPQDPQQPTTGGGNADVLAGLVSAQAQTSANLERVIQEQGNQILLLGNPSPEG